MSTVAFVGLGAMGSRMARRLLDAGHDLVVWNRSPEKAAELVRSSAALADSPADAALRADVVITMLSDPAALRAVVEGPDGIAAGLGSGGTLIDMSTVGPDAVGWLSGALPAGAQLLDAPVLGSIAEAEAGAQDLRRRRRAARRDVDSAPVDARLAAPHRAAGVRGGGEAGGEHDALRNARHAW